MNGKSYGKSSINGDFIWDFMVYILENSFNLANWKIIGKPQGKMVVEWD